MFNIVNNKTVTFNSNRFYVATKRVTDKDFTYETLDYVDINETDIGYILKVKKRDCFISMMVPISNEKIIMGNKPYYCNLNRTEQYVYSKSELNSVNTFLRNEINNEKNTPELEYPIAHLVNDEMVYSFSTGNTEALFTIYRHNYLPYIQILTYGFKDDDHTTFFIDRSSNYLINLKRFEQNKLKPIHINSYTNLHDMKLALYQQRDIYHRAEVADKIELAKRVQRFLEDLGIRSCLVGSGSLKMNDMDVNVDDIDLLIEPKDAQKLEDAKNAILNEFNVTNSEIISNPSPDNYASNIAFSFLVNGVKVEIDGYDYQRILTDGHSFYEDRIKKVDGICVSKLEYQFLCWLILEQDAKRSEFSVEYATYRNENLLKIVRYFQYSDNYDGELFHRSLFTKNADRYFEYVKDYTDRFIELYSYIKNSRKSYIDVRINDPFFVNAYESENSYQLVVYNSGSSNKARVIFPFEITECLWMDLEMNENCNVNFDYDGNITIIYLPETKSIGLLQIKT